METTSTRFSTPSTSPVAWQPSSLPVSGANSSFMSICRPGTGSQGGGQAGSQAAGTRRARAQWWRRRHGGSMQGREVVGRGSAQPAAKRRLPSSTPGRRRGSSQRAGWSARRSARGGRGQGRGLNWLQRRAASCKGGGASHKRQTTWPGQPSSTAPQPLHIIQPSARLLVGDARPLERLLAGAGGGAGHAQHAHHRGALRAPEPAGIPAGGGQAGARAARGHGSMWASSAPLHTHGGAAPGGPDPAPS